MAYNQAVEGFRDAEYPMLQGKTYLDHSGATIYAKSLIDSFSRNMLSNLYGNPHSASTPAELSGHMVDDVREKTLRFLGADPEEFDLVFVANATAAIKLVMESFRDLTAASSSRADFQYLYHKDAHTSLVGVREATRNQMCFRSDTDVEGWLEGRRSFDTLSSTNYDQLCLFAYPGQTNMTGRRLPTSWPGLLRHSKLPSHQNAYSLLDAAALATTSSLENIFMISDAAPDFTALSFYKIFGFPDLGALVVRRQSGHILSWRRYFGGGTVEMITVLDQPFHFNKQGSINNRLEDGTLGFHNILALGCAIEIHRQLYGSMELISQHVTWLINRLYTGLSSLRHSNGKPLCTIYNEPGNHYNDSKTQGGTIAFNVMHRDGSYISYAEVETEANDQQIYVRAGGLCNPGGIASYLSLAPWQMKRAWSAGHRCSETNDREIINGKPLGVVRASLGAMSTIADVDTFINWLVENYLNDSSKIATPLASIKPLMPITTYQPPDRQVRLRSSELKPVHMGSDSGLDVSMNIDDSINKVKESSKAEIKLPQRKPPIPHMQIASSTTPPHRSPIFHATVPAVHNKSDIDWHDFPRVLGSATTTLVEADQEKEPKTDESNNTHPKRSWRASLKLKGSWNAAYGHVRDKYSSDIEWGQAQRERKERRGLRAFWKARKDAS